MRLSKTAWLILGIGIFIIAFAALFMLHSQQSGEQEWLEDSLSVAQAALPQLIADKEDLESQLTQLESQLDQAETSFNSSMAKFPESVQSIEYGEELFDIAHDCHLAIASLSASEPTDQEVEDVTFATTILEVTVQAKAPPPAAVDAYRAYVDDTLANMLNFIDIVATSEHFTPATVDLVAMTFSDPSSADREKPSATIKLIIYVYEGE